MRVAISEKQVRKGKHSGLKRVISIFLCIITVLLMLAFAPILLSGAKPCVYENTMLGLTEEQVTAEWSWVKRDDITDTMAMETRVYQLWQREGEEMVAVFRKGKLCDYLIRDRKTDALRGSVAAEHRALSIWLRLRFGIPVDDAHYYDVGSGDTIDSWLTSDGKVIVWFDSAESWVHDAFTMKNADEYRMLTGLNTFIHLPYILIMTLFYRLGR